MTRLCTRLIVLLLLAVGVAACDKCGERVKFNAPTLSKACGDNANSSN